MALELIKISEFPEVNEPANWIPVADANGEGYRISQDNFKAWLGTVTVIADKPIALADPAPTMDGVYLPTESGTYTNAGGLVYDPEGVDAGKYVQFIKDDTVWTKLALDLPVLSTTGAIAPGVTDAISGDTAYRNNLVINESVKEIIGEQSTIFELGSISGFSQPINLSQGTVILDRKFDGIEAVSITVNAIVGGDMLFANYSITGNTASRVSFTTITLIVGLNTFIYPVSEGNYFGFAFNTASNLGRIGALNEPSTYGHWAENVNISTGTILGAKRFNQRIGVSIDIIKNESITKQVESAIKEEDLTTTSENLFDIASMVVTDKLINNSGDVIPVAGWDMARIPVGNLEGQTIFWGNSTSARSLMYAGFVDASDVLISGESAITFNPNTGGGSGVVPVGAKFLVVDIKEPADSSGVYTTFSASTGNSLKPYSPYNLVISEIKGIALQGGGGGEAYNQSLNTTDSVEFTELTTPVLKADAILSEAPVWDETGVAPIDIGYEYLYPSSPVGYQRRVRRA